MPKLLSAAVLAESPRRPSDPRGALNNGGYKKGDCSGTTPTDPGDYGGILV